MSREGKTPPPLLPSESFAMPIALLKLGSSCEWRTMLMD